MSGKARRKTGAVNDAMEMAVFKPDDDQTKRRAFQNEGELGPEAD